MPKLKTIIDEIRDNNQDLQIEVFPLVDYEKVPKVKGWPSKRGLTLTPSTVTYAINTEVANLVVLDGDRHSKDPAEDGVQKIKGLLESGGYNPFTSTLTVATPNSGVHVYFRLKPGAEVGNSSSGTPLGPGVDLRATGGYIVGPGSQVTKRDSTDRGEYKVLSSTLQIDEIPDFVLEAISGKRPKRKVKKSTQSKTSSNSVPVSLSSLDLPEERALACTTKTEKFSIPSHVKNSCLDQVNKQFLENFKEGKRHDTLNRLSFQLGLVAVPEPEAREVLKLDSRAIYKEWDEDPDEVFLTAYKDGINTDFSQEIFIEYRRAWNDEKGISNYSDPVLPEFFSILGLSERVKSILSDEIIVINKDLVYLLNKETKIWEAGSPSDLSSRVKKLVRNSLARDVRKEYIDLLSPANRKKLSSLDVKESRAISASIMEDQELSPKELKEKILSPESNLIFTNSKCINLRTGSYRPIKETDYCTVTTRAEYYPEKVFSEESKEIVECLLSCISEEIRDYFLLHVGQAATGHYSKYLIGLIGEPGIGKTALLESLSFVLGDSYSTLMNSGIFTKGNSTNFEVIRLMNKRLVRFEEFSGLEHGSSQDSINRIVDNAVLVGERKFQDQVTFKNNSTMFFNANSYPKIDEKKGGIQRRFLPFSCVKGSSYKEDIKTAFGNSKEAQEYLLFLVIQNSMRYLNAPEALNEVPEPIQEKVEIWSKTSDLLYRVLDVVEITKDSKDVVLLSDIAEALSSSKNTVSRRDIQKELLSVSQRIGIEVVEGRKRIPADSKVSIYKLSTTANHKNQRRSWASGLKFKKAHERA